jgi:hypothetical protein
LSSSAVTGKVADGSGVGNVIEEEEYEDVLPAGCIANHASRSFICVWEGVTGVK